MHNPTVDVDGKTKILSIYFYKLYLRKPPVPILLTTNNNIPYKSKHLPGLFREHTMPRPMKKMIRHTSLRAPNPRRRCRFLMTVSRSSIIDVKDTTGFLREPAGPAPGHILQDELGAEVVEQEVVFTRVDVQGEVMGCHH